MERKREQETLSQVHTCLTQIALELGASALGAREAATHLDDPPAAMPQSR